MRKLFALLMVLISFSSFAEDEIYTGFFSNKALSGYDTVSYFTEGQPVKGNSNWKTEYKG
ncbi:YHS domain protein, partial [Vibrio harveyi]|nr:YHS domain protein [Vibrio harveyi]